MGDNQTYDKYLSILLREILHRILKIEAEADDEIDKLLVNKLTTLINSIYKGSCCSEIFSDKFDKCTWQKNSIEVRTMYKQCEFTEIIIVC